MADMRPLFMQKVNAGDADITYTAQDMRRGLYSELYDEGVMDYTAFRVTPRAAGANISVDVAAGDAIVLGDDITDQGNYQCRRTALANLVLDPVPSGSNQRYDVIVLQVNDTQAGGGAGSNFTVTFVKGTAATTPLVPSLPASALPLAVVGPLTSSTTSISSGLIHDVWTGTGPAFASSCRKIAGQRDMPGTLKLYMVHADKMNGWLFCDGSLDLRATYPRLNAQMALLGYPAGAGDGSTTFKRPDLRGRVPVALDASTFATLGASGGEVAHTLTAAEIPGHVHPITDPGHIHTRTGGTYPGNTGLGTVVNMAGSPADTQLYSSGPTNSATTGITVNANTGGGGAHNIVQPYQVVAGWAIRT